MVTLKAPYRPRVVVRNWLLLLYLFVLLVVGSWVRFVAIGVNVIASVRRLRLAVLLRCCSDLLLGMFVGEESARTDGLRKLVSRLTSLAFLRSHAPHPKP